MSGTIQLKLRLGVTYWNKVHINDVAVIVTSLLFVSNGSLCHSRLWHQVQHARFCAHHLQTATTYHTSFTSNRTTASTCTVSTWENFLPKHRTKLPGMSKTWVLLQEGVRPSCKAHCESVSPGNALKIKCKTMHSGSRSSFVRRATTCKYLTCYCCCELWWYQIRNLPAITAVILLSQRSWRQCTKDQTAKVKWYLVCDKWVIYR